MLKSPHHVPNEQNPRRTALPMQPIMGLLLLFVREFTQPPCRVHDGDVVMKFGLEEGAGRLPDERNCIGVGKNCCLLVF